MTTEDKTSQAKFVSTGAAAKAIGAHPHTLRAWAELGRIEYIKTPGGKYRFNVEDFLTRERRSVQAASK